MASCNGREGIDGEERSKNHADGKRPGTMGKESA